MEDGMELRFRIKRKPLCPCYCDNCSFLAVFRASSFTRELSLNGDFILIVTSTLGIENFCQCICQCVIAFFLESYESFF